MARVIRFTKALIPPLTFRLEPQRGGYRVFIEGAPHPLGSIYRSGAGWYWTSPAGDYAGRSKTLKAAAWDLWLTDPDPDETVGLRD